MPRWRRTRASRSRTPGPAERTGRGWSSASSGPRRFRPGDQLAERRRLERRQPQVRFAQVEVGRQRVGDGNTEELRGLRSADAVGRVLECDGLERGYLEALDRRSIQLRVGLGPRHVLTTYDDITVPMDAEPLEMLHHPGPPRARRDRHLETESPRLSQVLLDARQQLLHRRGLLVVQP